jgi:hypothetical protein|tara:strand:+ start:2145 stop:2285 length:141 start_codon:yes stop_codon:yes gene_type:complete
MRYLNQLRTEIQERLMAGGSLHPMYIHGLVEVLALIGDIEQEAMGE